MLKNAWTVGKREFLSFFNSPIAYVFLAAFLVVTNGLYMWKFFIVKVAEMRDFFEWLPWTLLTVAPALTMRLWAEERRTGTLEVLLTMPVSTAEVVLGKFGAALALLALALAGTASVPATLAWLGNPDWGPIAGGYGGAFLLGAAYLAVGAFASSLCRDQIVAFLVGLALCFALAAMGTTHGFYAVSTACGDAVAQATRALSTLSHYARFAQGLLDTRDLVYFGSITGFFLFANLAIVQAKRY